MALSDYINNHQQGGVKALAFLPNKIPILIDGFFNEYGQNHGFPPTISKEELQRMLMAKIQMRDRTEENAQDRQNPNRYNPIVTDESHPSHFLNNPEPQLASDKMNWYKKARGVPGGLADKKKPSDFNKRQLDMGVEVEMEHTDDRDLSKDITMDHLQEYPTYYTELDEMERKLEEKKPAQRRGLYNQPQGDSYNQQAGEEILKDWEFANKEELNKMKMLAQQHRFEDLKDYGEELVQQGYDRILVEKLMTASMYKVKL